MVERGCGVWVGEGDWRVMRGVEGGGESQRERVDEVCEREVVRCKGEKSKEWVEDVCVCWH